MGLTWASLHLTEHVSTYRFLLSNGKQIRADLARTSMFFLSSHSLRQPGRGNPHAFRLGKPGGLWYSSSPLMGKGKRL